MADPFIAEIRVFGFNFAPINWAFCAGQTLAVQQNVALFSILGVNFGGNGTTNFQLPNLVGQVPIHAGSGPGLSPRSVGDAVGTPSVTLALPQLPAHTHALNVQNADANATPSTGNVLAKGGLTQDRKVIAYNTYVTTTAAPTLAMAQNSVTSVGGNQSHENRQPNLAMNFCIALYGQFPARP